MINPLIYRNAGLALRKCRDTDILSRKAIRAIKSITGNVYLRYFKGSTNAAAIRNSAKHAINKKKSNPFLLYLVAEYVGLCVNNFSPVLFDHYLNFFPDPLPDQSSRVHSLPVNHFDIYPSKLIYRKYQKKKLIEQPCNACSRCGE